MQNVTTRIEGDVLIIQCNLAAEGMPSTSGKSRVIASTHGNTKVSNSKLPGLTLGLNLYVPR